MCPPSAALQEPFALECKENPEHGLRLILHFAGNVPGGPGTHTPFLVQLDRCIQLARSTLQAGGPVYYRAQVEALLRFLPPVGCAAKMGARVLGGASGRADESMS